MSVKEGNLQILIRIGGAGAIWKMSVKKGNLQILIRIGAAGAI